MCKLTDDQLKEVTNTLAETRNDTDKLMEKIELEHANDDNSNAPLEEGVGEIIGDGIILESSEEDNFDHLENIDKDLDKIIEDNINSSLSDKFELNDEDALKFASVISRIRNKEKFNVYNELPDKLKKYIDDTVSDQINNVSANKRAAYLTMVSKLLIEELISDSEFDTLSIDLEKAMKELLPTPIEMYSEVNREYIEDKFLEVAEKIKEEDPVKAQNLLNMRQGFINAYKFENMYNLLNTTNIINKIRKADKLWGRIESSYYRIASVCKFKLYPLLETKYDLMKIGLSEESAVRVCALFVYEYNDIARNSFANYFEMNVRNLTLIDNFVSDFSKSIKDNLFNLSSLIDQRVLERETELLNNKKKRR